MPTPLAPAQPPITLAQSGLTGLGIAEPNPLPSPSLLDRFVFEQPWPAAIGLVALALVVLLKVRGKARAPLVFLGVLAAAGIVLTANLVTTPREQIMTSTTRLVQGVGAADLSVLDAELDESARLFSWLHQGGIDKKSILDEVAAKFGPGHDYAVHDVTILEMQAAKDGANVGRSQVKVRVEPDGVNAPFFSWWLINYRRDDSGRWRVVRLEPQSMSVVADPRARH